MSIFDKLGNLLTGGLANTVAETIKEYFPPEMSDEQKAQINLALQRIELEKEREASRAIAEAEKVLNERIAAHEGTAKDLTALPVVGRIVIFARGCQRPIWGFATLWADMQWFSGSWGALSAQQESALWMINVLVLGFLFGERAIKNAMPAIAQFYNKK